MIKNKLCFTLAIGSLITTSLFAQAPKQVALQNTTILKIQDLIKYDTKDYLVPLRSTSEALKLPITWDAKKHFASVGTQDNYALLTPNSSFYSLSNGSTLEMDVAPRFEKDRLWVPLSFFSQAFDFNVQHNIQDKSFSIDTLNSNVLYDDIVTLVNEGENTAYTNQRLSIRLEENPSTGYVWEVKWPTHLKVIDNHFINGSDLMGAPGMHTYQFKLTKPGTYTLTFNLKRSFEDQVVETKTFTIHAKDFVVPN